MYCPAPVIFLAAILLAPSAARADTQIATATDLVSSIQRAYRAARDIKGKLKQTWKSKLYGAPRIQWGYVFGAYPDKFSMKYVSPETSQFLCDGRQVWFWEPSANQAARVTDPRLLQGLRILVGSSALASEFTAVLERPASTFKYQLRLTPKQKTPHFDHIVLGVRHDFIIAEVTLLKKTETNRLELSAIVLNSRIPLSVFSFRPPAGTRILHAPTHATPTPRNVTKSGKP